MRWQVGIVPRVDGRTIPHITCYQCSKKGHYGNNCPDKVQQQHAQSGQLKIVNEQSKQSNEDEHGDQQHLHVENISDIDWEVIEFSWI